MLKLTVILIVASKLMEAKGCYFISGIFLDQDLGCGNMSVWSAVNLGNSYTGKPGSAGSHCQCVVQRSHWSSPVLVAYVPTHKPQWEGSGWAVQFGHHAIMGLPKGWCRFPSSHVR